VKNGGKKTWEEFWLFDLIAEKPSFGFSRNVAEFEAGPDFSLRDNF